MVPRIRPLTRQPFAIIESCEIAVWIDGLKRTDHPGPDGLQPVANIRSVSPSYLNTLKIPLIEGRDLEPSDKDHPGNALISLQTARAAWPGEDPVGKTLESEGTHTVVGVVADERVNDLKKAANMVYLTLLGKSSLATLFPGSQFAAGIGTGGLHSPGYLERRSTGCHSGAKAPACTGRRFDRDGPLPDSAAFELWHRRASAGAARRLGRAGIFGVAAPTGIWNPMARGSGKAALMRLVVRQASYPVIGGVLVGLGGAFLATR
jgi:MacB-like periplasmic core domain